MYIFCMFARRIPRETICSQVHFQAERPSEPVTVSTTRGLARGLYDQPRQRLRRWLIIWYSRRNLIMHYATGSVFGFGKKRRWWQTATISKSAKKLKILHIVHQIMPNFNDCFFVFKVLYLVYENIYNFVEIISILETCIVRKLWDFVSFPVKTERPNGGYLKKKFKI